MRTDLFEECLAYESDHFLLRPVEMADAQNLLQCYSDDAAVHLMNADNCNTGFSFKTLEEMSDYVAGWVAAYRKHELIRFAIVDRASERAVGTIEMFAKTAGTGVLRVDLATTYETKAHILEILALSVPRFQDGFGVAQILIKAIPEAAERVSALLEYGFVPVEDHVMLPHKHYYAHRDS